MLVICQSAKQATGAKESIIAQNETNDCFVYALGTAFDMPYDEAHKIAAVKFDRNDRKGPKGSVINNVMIEMMNAKTSLNGKTVTEVMDKPTTQYKVYGEVVNRSLRVGSFAKKFNQGTYLILIASHALTVKDGVVIDNKENDPSVKGIVRKAYKIGEGQ
jgi:flagellar hook-basal body complex protein FliE